MVVPELRKVKAQIDREGINEVVSSTKKYDFDFTNRIVFEKQYKQFFYET